LNAGFVHFITASSSMGPRHYTGAEATSKIPRGLVVGRSRLAGTIELRRATSTLTGKRRRPWLKALGWAAVAALSAFIIAVAAGLIHDDIKEPKRWPGPPPEVERNANGWGEPESFVGQYHVHFLRNIGPTRSNGYAEFAGERFREGQLTMFMREVYEHRPHVPGGVLVLQGHTHNLVVYLSELSSNGRVLYATVRGGTYEGPAIGSFGGVKRGNRIYGGLSLRGLANVEANFIRYSKNPDSRGGGAAGGTSTGAGGPPTEVLE
jgi:hypothetical protein